MAKNDIVLLDGIIEQRMSEGLPSNERDEVFEYLAFEQILKDFDLSKEEIEDGWLDGRDDGGIDGFFTIVNGHLLRDPGTFGWPKRNATLDIVIVTAKHHATFQQAPINSLLASLAELLDFGREADQLAGKYSEDILGARAIFQAAYRRLAASSPALSLRFVYASRGDRDEVADNVAARATQVVAEVRTLFSSAQTTFDFIGATELVTLYRRTKTFSLVLPFVEHLSRSGDSYVVLTKLGDYSAFVTDENGHLRRYLFDSNVRDYLGESTVNEDIGLSLKTTAGPEFWWLNNGVTILATGATVLGKQIQLQDVQIVNGLQTTETLFRHFSTGARESADKGLLVKVVVSTDTGIRDQIIRATNNQSVVEPQSLRATDKIQRDIEAILERHDWFYERRKNYYRNIGKPATRFVTPMYAAAGFVSLVLRNPDAAARLKSRFMRNADSYATVFAEDAALKVWPVIVQVLKLSEACLERFRPKGLKGERFLVRTRNLLAFLAVARIFKTFAYSTNQLVELDTSQLTRDMLYETWSFIEDVEKANREQQVKAWFPDAERCCKAAAATFGITNVESVGRATKSWNLYLANEAVDEDIVDRVRRELPVQPWKPRTHIHVAERMGLKASKVYAAIQILVGRGVFLNQKDGVLYGPNGEVVDYDPERVARPPNFRPNAN